MRGNGVSLLTGWPPGLVKMARLLTENQPPCVLMFDAYRPSLCSVVPEGVGLFSRLSTTTVSIAKKGGDGGRRGGEKGRWENRPGRGQLRGEAALQSFRERKPAQPHCLPCPLPPPLMQPPGGGGQHTQGPGGLLLCLQSRPGWGELTVTPSTEGQGCAVS